MKLSSLTTLTKQVYSSGPPIIYLFRPNANTPAALHNKPLPNKKSNGQTLYFGNGIVFIEELVGELIQYVSQIATNHHYERLGSESIFSEGLAGKEMTVKMLRVKASLELLNSNPLQHHTLKAIQQECIKEELQKEINKHTPYPTKTQMKEIYTFIATLFGVTERTVRQIRSEREENATKLKLTPDTRSTNPPLPRDIKIDDRYREIIRQVQAARAKENQLSKKEYREKNGQPSKFGIYDVFPRRYTEKGNAYVTTGSPLPLTTKVFTNNTEPFYPLRCPVIGVQLNYEPSYTQSTKDKGINSVRVWRLTKEKPPGPGNITIMSALATRLIEGTISVQSMFKIMNDETMRKWLEWKKWSKENEQQSEG